MRRRPALPAIAAVLVLVVGQLIAFAHQAAIRHVECTEHGEELEAPELAEQLHACADDHLVGVEGDGGEHHDDCLVMRAMHQSGAAPGMWMPLSLVAEVVLEPALLVRASAHVELDRYRLAPKTSPPALV